MNNNNPILYAGEGVLRLNSGVYINVNDLKIGDITIEDIAHNLSHACRFAGAPDKFFSVAEHSLMCSYLGDPLYALDKLLHDGSEFILADIPSPIKPLIAGYKELEDKIMKNIANTFGFAYPFIGDVKEIDRVMLEAEWENVVVKNRWRPLTHKIAKYKFIQRYYELCRH